MGHRFWSIKDKEEKTNQMQQYFNDWWGYCNCPGIFLWKMKTAEPSHALPSKQQSTFARQMA